MVAELKSRRIEVDDAVEANEYCFEHGLSDGLPIIPPTEKRVREFLEFAKLEPDHLVADYRPFDKQVTAEKLAINAVMAGCKPEYMPILIAAVKAITTEEYHLTHIVGRARWPLVIINGPQIKELGFNDDFSVFGSGTRANASIGRAMSLIMWNCLTSQFSEHGEQSHIGHTGRFNFCTAEQEDTPWEPLHVQRGFARTDNVVTVFPSAFGPLPGSGPRGMGFNASAEQWAEALTQGFVESRSMLTYYVMGIGQVIQDIFLKDGWSKEDLKRYIFDHASVTVAALKRTGRWQYFGTPDGLPPKIGPGDEETVVYLFKDRQQWVDKVWQPAELDREADILMVVEGRGAYGGGLTIVPSYNVGTRPVSVKVE